MPARSPLGPFRPGPGGMPPYLAGRSPEQRLFRRLLAALRSGSPPPSEVILYGPRGNGKTVLLRWLQEAAHSEAIETVVLRPSGIPEVARLRELLLPKSWWDRLTPREVEIAGFSWQPWNTGDERPPPLEDILAARTAKAPLLALLDEAQTLEIQVGRRLLNASQEVGRDLPFLLVLAGTPNLQSHLGAMGASFWSRARQVRIGRLDEVAAAEALRRPFEAEGTTLADAALARMVEESQGYPFFIQLLGETVWEAAAEREARGGVTAALFEAARPAFEEAKGEYYRHRVRELRREGLLAVGATVAAAFRSRPVLSYAQLEEAIRGGLGGSADLDEVERAASTLSDLGYIWETRARPEWEPGIPNLMDYLREFAPSP